MFKVNQKKQQNDVVLLFLMLTWNFCWLGSYFTPFSSASIVDLEQVNVSLIVLVNVVKNLWQGILFQKFGSCAVIKHFVDSFSEVTVEFFSSGIFGIREGARSRRIRKLWKWFLWSWHSISMILNHFNSNCPLSYFCNDFLLE